MSIFIIAVVLALLVGGIEGSDRPTFTRIRRSRVYQGGRSRVVGVGRAAWGRSPRVGRRADVDAMAAAAASAIPHTAPPRQQRSPIAYMPPPAPPAAPGNGGAPTPGGITVDFFQGILALVNASYEGPNDALRQLRSLGEGGRQWNGGLIRLHQRMIDRGDMRIDPFVADHVVRAAALGQAMVLELVEADTAMTMLLNMTLAEITERGLQVPNTR